MPDNNRRIIYCVTGTSHFSRVIKIKKCKIYKFSSIFEEFNFTLWVVAVLPFLCGHVRVVCLCVYVVCVCVGGGGGVG